MLCSRSWSTLGLLFALAGLVAIGGCQSGDTQDQQSSPPPLPDDEIAIENPWLEPAPAGSTGTLYMTIANGREAPDTLLTVRAPIIDSSAAYAPASDTATTMTEMSSLPLPARTRLALKPGSTHVKLFNLGQSLDEGSTPILNLEFAQSGLQRVRVPVRTSPPNSQ